MGGVFYSGQICAEVDCGGSPTGACCYYTGMGLWECVDGVTEGHCQTLGAYPEFTPGAACNEVSCPPPWYEGACCFGDDTCLEDVPQESCETEGGIWMDGACGDGVCTTDLLGPCCYYMGYLDGWNCEEEVTWAQCTTHPSPRYWSPDPESCEALPCPPPEDSGACCFGDGTCFDGVPQETCNEDDGVWTLGGDCASAMCDATGACCLPDDTCMDDVTDAVCSKEMDGIWNEGFSCADAQCDLAGGCCWGPFCLEATQWECGSWIDTEWLGVGPTCGSETCSVDPGGCCVEQDCLLTFEDECLGMGGVYSGNGIPCEVLEDCYPEEIAGACCLEDGVCEQLVPFDCGVLAGVFHGEGVSCDEAGCYSCPADIDGSGEADVDDLLMLIGQYGTSDPQADINNDGMVDVDDLLELMSQWGACIPTRYVGVGDDMEGTFTLLGQPDEVVPFTLGLEWECPLPQPADGPIPIEIIGLELVGQGPLFGDTRVTLTVGMNSGTVDLDGGELVVTGSATFHSELLNQAKAPERPYPGAPYLDDFPQSMTYTLTATVEPDGEEVLRVIAGDMHFTSVLPPDQLPVPVVGMHLPLLPNTVLMERKKRNWWQDWDPPLPPCQTKYRTNKREICIAPVVFSYTDMMGDFYETGQAYTEAARDLAEDIWEKACIGIRWEEPVVFSMDDVSWDGVIKVRAHNRRSPDVQIIMGMHDRPDCIEVFFVRGFKPAGRNFVRVVYPRGGGSKHAKIVIDDRGVDAQNETKTLAAAIGNALGLKTAGGNSNLMMQRFEPTGAEDRKLTPKQIVSTRKKTDPRSPKEPCCVKPD
jgi:hypothetical protein